MLLQITLALALCTGGQADSGPIEDAAAFDQLVKDRHAFQAQELTTAKPFSWIFNPGAAPRIMWRDFETVQRLGFEGPLRIRWIDDQLNESESPDHPGRWCAWIESTAPNGTVFRRALSFYARPKEPLVYFVPEGTVKFRRFPDAIDNAIWEEHHAEHERVAGDLLVRSINDSQAGAILFAGLLEAKPKGRPATYLESAAVLNDDFQLAVKLKLLGLDGQTRTLAPPRRRKSPAIELHEGTTADAGVRPDAKAKIDAVCREWAEDTGEPFVTLVARRGVIVTHEAFGDDDDGNPVDRNYRCWVASITKCVTAVLFSQFVDQGLIDFDDPLSAVFPDYPKTDPHVPTFGQCLNHTSGLSGHGEFGGMRNPHLENVLLNGIDVNRPGVRYAYCGMGYELTAKAMEIVTGKSAARLYHEHLFRPLGFGDAPIGNASSDGEFTARELAILAQWIANRGSYGRLEFIRPETFARMLPKPLVEVEGDPKPEHGMGLHWLKHVKPGAPATSREREDQLFGSRAIGHGSFSSCVLMIVPEQQLIVAQVRKESGPRHAKWSGKFFQTVAETCVTK